MKLLIALMIVLISMSLIAYLAQYIWPEYSDLFLSLFVEIIGIIITIFLVNQVLKMREMMRWKGVKRRIENRLGMFISKSITNIRSSLNYGTDSLKMDLTKTKNFKVENVHKELIRFTKEVMEIEAEKRIECLEGRDLRKLYSNMREMWDEVDKLFTKFMDRLTPTMQTLLLDIQDVLKSIITLLITFPFDYDMYPEVYDMEKARSRRKLIDPKVAEDLKKVLRLIRQLDDTIKIA